MLGIIQVGDVALPPNTGPVTQEVPMVLNDAGVIGLSINGKSFPATAPIIAHVGDWVELNYFNDGLQIHPMHLHGLPQLVIAEDGCPLASPYTVDTIAVAPGQRFTTLVHVTSDFLGPNNTPGIWAFHCHILTHAEGPTACSEWSRRSLSNRRPRRRTGRPPHRADPRRRCRLGGVSCADLATGANDTGTSHCRTPLHSPNVQSSRASHRHRCETAPSPSHNIAEWIIAFIKDYNRRAQPFRWTENGRLHHEVGDRSRPRCPRPRALWRVGVAHQHIEHPLAMRRYEPGHERDTRGDGCRNRLFRQGAKCSPETSASLRCADAASEDWQSWLKRNHSRSRRTSRLNRAPRRVRYEAPRRASWSGWVRV